MKHFALNSPQAIITEALEENKTLKQLQQRYEREIKKYDAFNETLADLLKSHTSEVHNLKCLMKRYQGDNRLKESQIRIKQKEIIKLKKHLEELKISCPEQIVLDFQKLKKRSNALQLELVFKDKILKEQAKKLEIFQKSNKRELEKEKAKHSDTLDKFQKALSDCKNLQNLIQEKEREYNIKIQKESPKQQRRTSVYACKNIPKLVTASMAFKKEEKSEKKDASSLSKPIKPLEPSPSLVTRALVSNKTPVQSSSSRDDKNPEIQEKPTKKMGAISKSVLFASKSKDQKIAYTSTSKTSNANQKNSNSSLKSSRSLELPIHSFETNGNENSHQDPKIKMLFEKFNSPNKTPNSEQSTPRYSSSSIKNVIVEQGNRINILFGPNQNAPQSFNEAQPEFPNYLNDMDKVNFINPVCYFYSDPHICQKLFRQSSKDEAATVRDMGSCPSLLSNKKEFSKEPEDFFTATSASSKEKSISPKVVYIDKEEECTCCDKNVENKEELPNIIPLVVIKDTSEKCSRNSAESISTIEMSPRNKSVLKNPFEHFCSKETKREMQPGIQSSGFDNFYEQNFPINREIRNRSPFEIIFNPEQYTTMDGCRDQTSTKMKTDIFGHSYVSLSKNDKNRRDSLNSVFGLPSRVESQMSYNFNPNYPSDIRIPYTFQGEEEEIIPEIRLPSQINLPSTPPNMDVPLPRSQLSDEIKLPQISSSNSNSSDNKCSKKS